MADLLGQDELNPPTVGSLSEAASRRVHQQNRDLMVGGGMIRGLVDVDNLGNLGPLTIQTSHLADDAVTVEKIADGAARQVLQTAANGTDVEWTDDVDLPGTLDVTGEANFDANVILGSSGKIGIGRAVPVNLLHLTKAGSLGISLEDTTQSTDKTIYNIRHTNYYAKQTQFAGRPNERNQNTNKGLQK